MAPDSPEDRRQADGSSSPAPTGDKKPSTKPTDNPYRRIIEYHRDAYSSRKPSHAAVEARKAAEAVCKGVIEFCSGKKLDKPTIETLLQAVKGLVPEYVEANIKTIQSFGNIGGHDYFFQDERVSAEAFKACLVAMTSLVRWFIERYGDQAGLSLDMLSEGEDEPGRGLRCPGCGTVAASGMHFCVSCGSPLVLLCRSCGKSVKPEAPFCGSCGSRLLCKDCGERLQPDGHCSSCADSVKTKVASPQRQSEASAEPPVAGTGPAAPAASGSGASTAPAAAPVTPGAAGPAETAGAETPSARARVQSLLEAFVRQVPAAAAEPEPAAPTPPPATPKAGADPESPEAKAARARVQSLMEALERRGRGQGTVPASSEASAPAEPPPGASPPPARLDSSGISTLASLIGKYVPPSKEPGSD